MNSKEHLEEAERWLEEAERGYAYAPASDTGWMKVRSAVVSEHEGLHEPKIVAVFRSE